MKKKTKTRSESKKLYIDNVEMAKTIAKKRDNYICQKCWNKGYIHGSHIINEARDHRLSTNEDNIKALCYNCHFNWRHKNPVEAGDWFREKFPGRYERLYELHLQYMSMWSIGLERHQKENERLKAILKSIDK